MSQQLRIAVDGMGGDHYPETPIRGVWMALNRLPGDFTIQIVGDRDTIEHELLVGARALRYRDERKSITIVPASQVITGDEKPVEAIAQKPDASINVGMKLVSSHEADAFVSAGNTGALMVGAIKRLGRIKGISRPALVAVYPTANGPLVLLDVGANPQSSAIMLAQSALMGSVYYQQIFGVIAPRVALMNVGKEPDKGPPNVVEAYRMLMALDQQSIINFIGNCEGNDILRGDAHVISIDGFSGNMLLKHDEEIIPMLNEAIKRKLRDSSIFRNFFALASKLLLKPTLAAIKHDFDYQRYGGVPLLGINGVVIKAHGRSTPLAFMHAIDYARKTALGGVNEIIEQKLQQAAIPLNRK